MKPKIGNWVKVHDTPTNRNYTVRLDSIEVLCKKKRLFRKDIMMAKFSFTVIAGREKDKYIKFFFNLSLPHGTSMFLHFLHELRLAMPLVHDVEDLSEFLAKVNKRKPKLKFKIRTKHQMGFVSLREMIRIV